MLQAILFDLDGTLLPMDNDTFTEYYLRILAEEAYPWGYTDSKAFVKSIWAGVKAMVLNDGSTTNYDAFWKKMEEIYGSSVSEDIPKFSRFYSTRFDDASAACMPSSMGRKAVDLAHTKAEKVILATNPIFPRNADVTRMNWVNLKEEDFDLITDYENCNHCKPNPQYFQDIIDEFNLDPSKCLMIGNNTEEDWHAGEKVGFPVYLITDCLINPSGEPVTCPHGTFEELINFLETEL